MRGDKVIVRALRDEPLVRRVWDVNEKAVFICSEENFRLLTKGQMGLWPVGFFREDVFRYDASMVHGTNGQIEPDPTLWERLIPWQEE